ncbi:MAG TPA: AmmeMemoRadiSam system protein A [Gammaproteobacteria bacterium]|nr:AmmeMemoRadiSam system protein A [Gammaproteobacteria bacterium]
MSHYGDYKDPLLELARQSIEHGLEHSSPARPDINRYPDALREPGAAFVTLQINGQLRGCIGSLEAYRPLVDDIADNAYAAAFRDPRFAPVSDQEFPELDIAISILTKPQPMSFESEQDLLAQLQPGIDGLILESAGRRGTYLPSVWESLTTPDDFFNSLKTKAGLPADYWADDIKVWRYRTESIHPD